MAKIILSLSSNRTHAKPFFLLQNRVFLDFVFNYKSSAIHYSLSSHSVYFANWIIKQTNMPWNTMWKSPFFESYIVDLSTILKMKCKHKIIIQTNDSKRRKQLGFDSKRNSVIYFSRISFHTKKNCDRSVRSHLRFFI